MCRRVLAGLSMPVESTFRVSTGTDGSVHYWHSLYREGAESDWSFEGRESAMQHDLASPTDVTIINGNERTTEHFTAANNPGVVAEVAAVAAENRDQFGSRATGMQRNIDSVNRAIEESNARIVPILTETTGQQFGNNPRSWWDWWSIETGYETKGVTPVREQQYATQTHRYYRRRSLRRLTSLLHPRHLPRLREAGAASVFRPALRSGRKPVDRRSRHSKLVNWSSLKMWRRESWLTSRSSAGPSGRQAPP